MHKEGKAMVKRKGANRKKNGMTRDSQKILDDSIEKNRKLLEKLAEM